MSADCANCEEASVCDTALGWERARGTDEPEGVLRAPGLRVLWTEMKASKPALWTPLMGRPSLEICANVSGEAKLECRNETMSVAPGSLMFFCLGDEPMSVERLPGKKAHRFLAIGVDLDFVKSHFGSQIAHLHPLAAAAVRGDRFESGFGPAQSLYADQERQLREMSRPPVPQAAEGIWVLGRALELLARCLFKSGGSEELFCDRQKRLARSRSEKVIDILRDDLENPPSLEELGRKVGCSQYYLSRTFSKETGKTIPQYLRRLRMERAAELLSAGEANVTEAALEVGYNSMSHFSQAFCQEMGVCPALYRKEAS